jgi:hypothetical protein
MIDRKICTCREKSATSSGGSRNFEKGGAGSAPKKRGRGTHEITEKIKVFWVSSLEFY